MGWAYYRTVMFVSRFQGKSVKLFMLNTIRKEFGIDVRFEDLSAVKGACAQVELPAVGHASFSFLGSMF
jgi:hypothetical protein